MSESFSWDRVLEKMQEEPAGPKTLGAGMVAAAIHAASPSLVPDPVAPAEEPAVDVEQAPADQPASYAAESEEPPVETSYELPPFEAVELPEPESIAEAEEELEPPAEPEPIAEDTPPAVELEEEVALPTFNNADYDVEPESDAPHFDLDVVEGRPVAEDPMPEPAPELVQPETCAPPAAEPPAARAAKPSDRTGRTLVSRRLITQDQLDSALDMIGEGSPSLGSILISCGFITEDLLVKALAAQMGVPAWDFQKDSPTPQAVDKVSAELCRLHTLLPVQVRGDLLLVAMADPSDMKAIEAVRRASGMRIEPVFAFDQRLVKAIEESHGALKGGESLKVHVTKAMAEVDPGSRAHEEHRLTTDNDDRPVVSLVNQILKDAIRLRASDVHIEPRTEHVDIRYRVDGQLQKVREIPHTLLPMLVTRLKIMAELDIVEFRMPQDGRVAVTIDGRMVDLRVSVLPNHHGQRIVLRILDKTVALKKLTEIGFTESNLGIFRSLIQKPYGMLLVTGPTGSGKTTTLYAALEELRQITSNIMTCEDPIEYDIQGINQSQVHEKVGLTFAAQLRAILRQDPDIILVGEIRDGETAQTAIRAAMTGHLVLSTLHCNDAPSSIPRLLDMGTDPFLLSTSLVGVMSQRLVRVLCPHCKEERAATGEELDLIESIQPGASKKVGALHSAVGCPRCDGMGYFGRTAVHEIMPITPDVSRSIAAREPIELVRDQASAYGYRPMQEAALRLVLEGETTLAEAKRYVAFHWQAPLETHLRAA